jgi:hypothetical protein
MTRRPSALAMLFSRHGAALIVRERLEGVGDPHAGRALGRRFLIMRRSLDTGSGHGYLLFCLDVGAHC